MTPPNEQSGSFFVFAAVFLRLAGGFVKRLEPFRETPGRGFYETA